MDEKHGLKNSLWHHILKFERRKRDPRVLRIFKATKVYIFWYTSLVSRVRCIFLAAYVVNCNSLVTSFSLTVSDIIKNVWWRNSRSEDFSRLDTMHSPISGEFSFSSLPWNLWFYDGLRGIEENQGIEMG